MELVNEFCFNVNVGSPMPVGEGPNGTRIYYAISDGDVNGTRINGKIRGGGEWALIGSDGFLRVDVRTQIETHDGTFLYVQYLGFLEMNLAFETASENGHAAGFVDQYFYTNPRIETGDSRYSWVNTTFLSVRDARSREGALPTGFGDLRKKHTGSGSPPVRREKTWSSEMKLKSDVLELNCCGCSSRKFRSAFADLSAKGAALYMEKTNDGSKQTFPQAVRHGNTKSRLRICER